MSTNKVTKNLISMEDFAQGTGKVTQKRGEHYYDVSKVDIPYPVKDEAELALLDITRYSRASIEGLEYRYDPYLATGDVPSGDGSWVRSNVSERFVDTIDNAKLLDLTNFDAIYVGGAKYVKVASGEDFIDRAGNKWAIAQTTVSYISIDAAVSVDNSGYSRVLISGNYDAPYHKVLEDEAALFPASVKFKDLSGQWWALLTRDELPLEYLGVTTNSDITQAVSDALSYTKTSVVLPSGVFNISSTITIPEGKSLVGQGIDYWDTYRPAPDVLLKSVATGTHLLFTGVGPKVYSCINLANTVEDKDIYGLTKFTNEDSTAGSPATPKLFSVGVILGRDSELKDIRLVPNFNGIAGYNDYSTTNLGDDWDVGLWCQGANESVVHNVQVVGYWRLAGTLVTENDGSYTQVGNPERLRINYLATTGVRGLLVRNTPQWGVSSNTTDTITCEYSSSWTLTSQNKFRVPGSDSEHTFTGYSVSGGEITLTGVTPDLPDNVSVLRSPNIGNNLSGTVFENSYAASLEHSSGTASEDLGLPVSGALEVSGYPLRGMKFVNSKLQTTSDKLNTILADCRDFKLLGCQLENGALVAYSNSETAGYTSNLRLTNTYITDTVNRDNFTPRDYFNDYDSFPTQFTNGDFIVQPAISGKAVFKAHDGFVRLEYGDTGVPTKLTTGSNITFSNASGESILDMLGSSKNVTANGTVRVTTGLAPVDDNTVSCGVSDKRWSVVYAASGTIDTSDARHKSQVRPLSEVEQELAVELKSLIRLYKFNDAVESKGNNARLHVGVIAQEVKAAFESKGLDGFKYGVLCYDEWDNKVVEGTNSITPAGDIYGIRYNELLCFIIAAL